MNDPRFDDQSPLECGGCGEEADYQTLIDGALVPICGDCLHDSTFICPDCQLRHWSANGHRLYVSPSLYCAACFKQKDDGIAESWQRFQDEYRDDFNQIRRG